VGVVAKQIFLDADGDGDKDLLMYRKHDGDAKELLAPTWEIWYSTGDTLDYEPVDTGIPVGHIDIPPYYLKEEIGFNELVPGAPISAFAIDYNNDNRGDVLALRRKPMDGGFYGLQEAPYKGDFFQLLVATDFGYEETILDDGSDRPTRGAR
jgi:hypothetical protein